MILQLCSLALAGDLSVQMGESIQDALDQAQPGDTITIQGGTYNQDLISVVDGTETLPIILKAADGEEVIITQSGEVFQIEHSWIHVDGIIFDGQYGAKDILDIRDGASNLLLSNIEVRHSGRDCVDIKGPSNVTIEDSLIHHCLNWDGERVDAHGLAAGNALSLTIRNTEIHTFSGDGIQIDPDRLDPPWNDLLIEDCLIWLEPLTEESNGFPQGAVPGENAFDSKTWDENPERSNVTIRRTRAYGFRDGLISNMAAFNIKEGVDVHVDKVQVHDSEIAFRLRGPGRDIGAAATITNTLIYDVEFGFRYEDDIETVNIWNVTVGLDVGQVFKEASSENTLPDVRNMLVLGDDLPVEAAGTSNLATGSESFVGAQEGDYHLVEGSVAIDAGEAIEAVTEDLDGAVRPSGEAIDIGAYEFQFPIEEPEETPSENGEGFSDEEPQKESGCSTVDSMSMWLMWCVILIRRRL